MPFPVGFFALAAGAIVAVWWWLGAVVAMPPSPLAAGEKLHCLSYAPFRGDQNPLEPATHIPACADRRGPRPARAPDRLHAQLFGQHGLDQIPEIAKRHGLKVIHGIWLSSNAEKNQQEIATSVALAKKFPDVIQSIVVGNEVLLRGEIAANDLAGIIREREGAGHDAGHLCRCLGILVAQSRRL